MIKKVNDNMNFLIISTIFILVISLILQYRYLQKFKNRDIYMNYLINDFPLGIYMKDTKGNILFANKTFSAATGVNINTLKCANVNNIYPKDIDHIIKNTDNEVLKNNISTDLETQLTFNQEGKHHYRLSKHPIYNGHNNLSGYFVLLNKIDKEKETEAIKESFIATLAHDLKNPTFAQINTLNLLANEEFGPLTAQQREMITLTKNSCNYLAALINTILDTYRFENGKIKLKLEKIDIVELITNICKELEILAEEKKQNIIFTHKTQERYATVDKLQLKRVISNILSNAIQYGFSGTNIHVELKHCNNTLEFAIKNKSKKITNKELSTIFDRFNSTSMSHFNSASTGLGLYLTKQIIEMHKGEVFANSADDGICTFGFRLNTTPVTEAISDKISK